MIPRTIGQTLATLFVRMRGYVRPLRLEIEEHDRNAQGIQNRSTRRSFYLVQRMPQKIRKFWRSNMSCGRRYRANGSVFSLERKDGMAKTITYEGYTIHPARDRRGEMAASYLHQWERPPIANSVDSTISSMEVCR